MIRIGLCLLSTVAFLGCGDGGADDQVPVYAVSGTVSMFGAPLSGAVVAFAPTEGQPTAIGKTDGKGKFHLTTYDFGDGAAAGRYTVVISKSVSATSSSGAAKGPVDEHGEPIVEHDAGGSQSASGDGNESMVPPQYSTAKETPLSAEVKSDGENEFSFEIQ